MEKHDITEYGYNELCLIINNTESLYDSKHSFTREFLSEIFIFTDDQYNTFKDSLED